ncbi:asparagine synthase (glutamine-hydrolyzing) [Aliarcobacter butzleri]|uniref:asparagine synthase (glutamine-hydrolyzing) n=1 Tax=Aliarcobacter butzleri TaxID=28197 RepID=UPI00214B6E11|nr:asparagine synthase (glutamine-hydrolyzing) [Aliarcobacter butzleri]MCP3650036.1 asparagine synthase (glutamine-hydrolyzing) [Arcobacter sp. DNRA7]MCR1816209.1 asparagine synthase (glutamine-hydrolyzing) [Aliarcobacter butzleri]
MCGIVGFIDFNKELSNEKLINMTDVIHHRGPNDSGYSFFKTESANIGLGHRRLSILDLSAHGHQPMQYEDFEIIFNGEVYNFKEIKEELTEYSFFSDSDTEVILKAFHKWGIKAVDKFNGMFAIAIYDKSNEKITLIRDRTGIKPLYYYQNGNLFLFGSELKSFYQCDDFEKDIDFNALAQFFHYGYIPQPYSIFKNCFKLKAGHYLEIDLKSQKFEEKKYWDVKDFYNLPKKNISYEDAKNEIEKLLISSFNYRMVSDVPVGVFLSGGYDSSAVASILQKTNTQKIKTFSIGFNEEGYNEAHHAKKVAEYLGTEHIEYYCTQKEALEILPTLAEIYDEPFGDSSAIPTILVSKLAKKDVTVALSADAGDEIFGGYGKYKTSLKYFEFFSKFPKFSHTILSFIFNNINPNKIPILRNKYNIASRFKKIADILKSNSAVMAMKYTSHMFTQDEIRKLFNHNFIEYKTYFDTVNELNSSNDELNKMFAIDYQTYLVDDILTKVDRATMSVSLEGREPLLDYRIIEYVAQLPSSFKMNDKETKIVLKDIVHKYIPKEIMDRPKMGFGVPISEWFRDELKEYFYKYFEENNLKKAGLNPNEVIRLRDEYLSGKDVNTRRLWFILMYMMWYEKWM